MPILLDAADEAGSGERFKIIGPTTIFVESDDFDGQTISIGVSRTLESAVIEIGSFTEAGVMNDTIIGEHYLEATLSGTPGDPVTVATLGSS